MVAANFGEAKIELCEPPKKQQFMSLPALQVDEKNVLTSEVAISQFLAPSLLGKDLKEQSLCTQWSQWVVTQLVPVLSRLAQMTFGEEEHVTKEMYTAAYATMKGKMEFINLALNGKKWLCGGENATLADVYLGMCQIDLQYGLAEKVLLESLPNSNAHFTAVLAMAPVAARVGAPK
jgi:glutathione S-transferase